MKRKGLKVMLFIVLIIMCVVFDSNTINAMETQRDDFVGVEVERDEYSEKKLEEIVSVLSSNEKLCYGASIQCYNVNNNEMLTFIPIYNKEKCVYVATCEKNGTLSISNDSDFVNELHNEFENDKNVLLYINGNSFFAESSTRHRLIEKYPISLNSNKKFKNFSLDQKVDYIQDKVGEISDKSDSMIIENKNIYMYPEISNLSAKLSTNNDTALQLNKCNITNFVRQEYGNCWAASVATIVNYKKSMNLSAGDVSYAMGMSWYLGGDVNNVRDALKYYGLSYTTKIGGPISWIKLKADIDRNRPFSLGFACSDNKHMVTGYGYAEKNRNRYVAIWDSNGYQRLLTYTGNDTQITMYGYTYTWKDTVY